MIEISRIEIAQARIVAELWDRKCREVVDGGPLTDRGLANIDRMLQVASFHHETIGLVAADGATILGFVVARFDPGDGLLPHQAGELQELYVVPGARNRGLNAELAAAAVAWLRLRGAQTIRTLVCADNHESREFWERQGFTPDMVCLSLYQGD
ncbi:MAG: GNAT family N-acetyltransferase [Geodermatophilaceae bacterium]